MDREGIRRLAAETLGLPTSPYKFADSLEELQAAIDGGIGYPCIVKPVMTSSGKGQSKIDGPADVKKAWDYAMAGGRVSHGRVIVEGFIDFDYEITQLTVRAIGADGDTETHFCEPIGHVQVHGDYVESWQPHAMTPVALQRSREIAQKITDDLGGLGLFGVELFVKGDEVWFSEVSPRPHDTGMVTMITQCAERVRAACPRHPRPAGRCLVARDRCFRGHLRTARGNGYRFQGGGRGFARAGIRHSFVRQAGILQAPSYGRGAGER